MEKITEEREGEGHFIAIEGIDSSGKKTQARKMVEKLKNYGKKVKYADFPTYESTTFGKLIAKFLRGEFGEREEIPIEIINMLFAMDRYQFKEEYENFLSEGGIIVSNRYTQSNLSFQTADLDGLEWKEMVEWIMNLEKRIPQPDEVIVLNIDPYKAQELMDDKEERDYLRGRKKDINEEKIDFQEKAAENYLKLAEKFGWEVIDCIEDGRLKSIEEINKEIMEKLRPKFNIRA